MSAPNIDRSQVSYRSLNNNEVNNHGFEINGNKAVKKINVGGKELEFTVDISKQKGKDLSKFLSSFSSTKIEAGARLALCIGLGSPEGPSLITFKQNSNGDLKSAVKHLDDGSKVKINDKYFKKAKLLSKDSPDHENLKDLKKLFKNTKSIWNQSVDSYIKDEQNSKMPSYSEQVRIADAEAEKIAKKHAKEAKQRENEALNQGEDYSVSYATADNVQESDEVPKDALSVAESDGYSSESDYDDDEFI